MNFASIIFNFIMFLQGPCAGCPSGNPCAPCCSNPGGCGGGPPPPPGLPIDNFTYVLFFIAIVFGTYMILKMNKNSLAS